MSLEQKNDWEQKIDIKSLELEELTEQLVQMGLPKFRGGCRRTCRSQCCTRCRDSSTRR